MTIRPTGLPVAACVTAVACGWNLTSVGAAATTVGERLDVSLGTVGLLGSALWLAHALAQAPAGRALDVVGLRAVAVAATTALLVTNALAALTGSLALIVVLRVLTGVACGATMVAASVRARACGVFGQGAIGGAVSGGAALAVATGPLLSDAIGWRAPMFGGAALAALAIFAARTTPTPAPPTPRGPTGTSAHAAGAASLGVLAAVLATTIVASFALGNWIVTILDRAGTFGGVAAGLAGATVVGGSVVTRPLGGLLLARDPGRDRTLVLGSLGVAALCAAVLAVASQAAVVLVAMIGLGLAAGLPFAAVVHAAATAHPESPGTAVGRVGTVGTLGGVAAIALLGPVVSAGAAAAAFAGLAALTALTAAAYARQPAPTRTFSELSRSS